MTKTLHGLRVPRETIKLSDDQEFEVRGIGSGDLMHLTMKHGALMAMVYGKVQTSREPGQPVSPEFVKETLLSIASEFPDLAATLIAMASDSFDDEVMAVARGMNLLTQIEALEAIFRLTFTSEAAVKKLLESLTRIAAAATGALTGVTVSPDGIGVSVAT